MALEEKTKGAILGAAAAGRKRKESKTSTPHSFNVKQADGGFVVETRKEGEESYDPGKTSVHKTLSSVHKHMKACCGGPTDSGDKGDDE